MANIVLAVFIASAASFDAGVAEDGSFRQATFPNSDQGIAQLAEWLQKGGVSEFDRICVSGPPIGSTPARQFWSTRKTPVFLLPFGQVEQYMQQHRIPAASAEVVAKACVASPPAKRD